MHTQKYEHLEVGTSYPSVEIGKKQQEGWELVSILRYNAQTPYHYSVWFKRRVKG